MSYVDDTLLRNERVLYRGNVHWIIFMPTLIYTAAALACFYFFQGGLIAELVSGFLLFFAVVSFLKSVIYFFSTEFAVTDSRVLAKFGLIRRTTFELSLDRVMSLNVNQTVLGRIFNYGDVYVNGIGNFSTPIPAVHDPLVFRKWALQEV